MRGWLQNNLTNAIKTNAHCFFHAVIRTKLAVAITRMGYSACLNVSLCESRVGGVKLYMRRLNDW